MWLASMCIIGVRTIAQIKRVIRAILGETAVTWQLQSQLQLWPIAATIILCNHRVKGLTKPQVESVLRLSSRTLSYLYTSHTGKPIGLHASLAVQLSSDDMIWLWCIRIFNLWCDVDKCFALDASSICLRCMLLIILLLWVCNLQRVFSKCSFRWHSAYFHSAVNRKKSASNFLQIIP